MITSILINFVTALGLLVVLISYINLIKKVRQLEQEIKKEAYEAYWQASDENRADRWADDFDERVQKSFEDYWLANKEQQ